MTACSLVAVVLDAVADPEGSELCAAAVALADVDGNAICLIER